MAEPFASTQEYIQTLLQLVDRRLAILEESASGDDEAREEALLLAGRIEERMRRRCQATVDAGGTPGRAQSGSSHRL